MATSEMSPDYSETEAFKVFAAMCWEQHKERHPAANIDPTRFAEISTGRWKAMTQEQKNAFFHKFQEDEERKAKQAKRKNVQSKSPGHEKEPKKKKSSASTDDEVKKEIEPMKPKNKKTAMSFYISDVGAKFRKDNSNLTQSEATKAIHSNWDNLPANEKKKYLDLAEEDQKRFESEKSNYESQIASANKDVKKPKGKKSAFDFYASEKASEIKKQNPNISKNHVSEKVKELWEKLNGEEKQKYNDMASKDEARFDEQMKNFQAATSPTVYKVAKDPNKPKQAKNPFMFFMAEYSVKIRSENPDSHMSVGDVAKQVSAKWASLTDAEKLKYVDMADKDKQRHEEEMKNYQAPPPVMVAVNGAKDPNKPKAPKNAYSLFGKDISAQIRSENGNISLSETSKEIGKRWKEADADTRSKYEKLAAADKQRYDNEMKDYKPLIKPMKKQKDPNKPKKNLSAFMFFSIETGATMRKENSGMSTTDISKAIGSLWKEIDAEKRKKYDGMAEKDVKRYEDEMELYNAGKFVPKIKNDSKAHDTETGVKEIKNEPLE